MGSQDGELVYYLAGVQGSGARCALRAATGPLALMATKCKSNALKVSLNVRQTSRNRKPALGSESGFGRLGQCQEWKGKRRPSPIGGTAGLGIMSVGVCAWTSQEFKGAQGKGGRKQSG